MIKIKTIDSLQKVFPLEEPDGEMAGATLFQNERFSFQIAFFVDKENWGRGEAAVALEGTLAPYASVKQVGLAPCEFPCYERADGYLRTEPGMIPDVLKPLNGPARYLPRRWESLWVTVAAPAGETLPAGEHTLALSLTTEGETVRAEVTLTVLPAVLPPQEMLFTQWLHCDGIAQYHRVPMFSETFWAILERYIRMAADYGVNLLLTPLFTPPLDTRVGGERMTCQLVDVFVEGTGAYRFDFRRLARWMETARRCGITHFELSHLFTQWGAKSAPKVMGEKAGETVRLFGWDTPAAGGEYERFLAAFLPALDAFLKREGAADCCFLHVSDEPERKDLSAYTAAAEIVAKYMPGYPVMDAMSDYAIFRESRVSDPVVGLDHMGPFLEQKVSPLWGYTCCAQCERVSNRFLAMPSYRNRIAGVQGYKFGLRGFLHWGYNFYNSQYSLEPVDPYASTDAGRGFPSGDPFSVYPEGDGCTESLRLCVFYDALQDVRALKLLESLAGKEWTLAFLEKRAPGLTFEEYPRDARFLLDLRQAVNEEIRRRL